jgi:periodic tryptophan protein 1
LVFSQDTCTLEVRVFNEKTSDFYVHHDYMLSAPALCIESIGFDPGAENRKV